LADPDLVSFDADRADFNGALAQFAIGLLTTFAPLKSTRDWEQLFAQPPSRETLQSWWIDSQEVFRIEGETTRFMQDAALSAKAESSIGGLLIDSPGENTLKNNSDHFVKRGRINQLCPHCAATALFTLQVNAPSGGAGHRTGLRGGGPLTTLLTCQPTQSLWHDLWLNVIEPPDRDEHGGDPDKTELHFTFPWMKSIDSLQKTEGQTAPIQTHPMHIHWAMPRRIRLDFDQVTDGECDICHRKSNRLVTRYATVNKGLNYKGPWDHVLSPYYQAKEDWLPLHPQPGGFGYRHWLPWLVGMADARSAQRPARVVTHFQKRRRSRQAGVTQSLWAFGFDMDNMKPRCWYEARLPVYNLDGCETGDIKVMQEVLQSWLNGANDCSYALRNAVKLAWVGPEGRGDFSAVDAAFWSRTESAFYELLQALIGALGPAITGVHGFERCSQLASSSSKRCL
jgi:CRISPR system Cascade subunit CasA